MKVSPADKLSGVVVELDLRETQLPTTTVEKTEKAQPIFRLMKVLVPVDFSNCSKKALQYAIPLAKQFNAEVMLLHVTPSNPPMPELEPADVVAVDAARDRLETLERQVSREVTVHAILRVQRKGALYAEIVQVAKELGIDLIVIATHGRTGLGRVFLGGTTEKVVRHAGCPVLIVREREREFVANTAMGWGEGITKEAA